MVISGDTNTHRADYTETVADMTVNCLKELCPKDLGV